MENETLSEKEEETTSVTFEDFGLKPKIMQGVQDAGFKEPSPIQVQAIPLVLAGHDLIGQAQTGTGKTAAFGLPVMNNLKYTGDPEILVISPTRELASQIGDELFRLGRFAGVRTVCVYGGQSIKYQIRLMDKKPQIIVATPGRLLDHLKSSRFRVFEPHTVILDESDEMLDMGFLEDIKEILSMVPSRKQTLLFSATMPDPIKKLAETILIDPKMVKVESKELTNEDIEQKYYVIDESERDAAIIRLLEHENPSRAIIFTRMKREADVLSLRLANHGFSARALHGDMEQGERQDVLLSFKKGRMDMLVATDVAARGLDISGVSHVFNYHIPLNPESYVHRIGRTGRAGNKGIAITLATPLEFKELRRIREKTNVNIELYTVPTRHETLQSKESQLIDEILSYDVSDLAIEFYEKLHDQADASQIAIKLLTMMLKDSHSVTGPERIGMDKEALLNFLRKLDEENDGKKKGRGGFNRDKSGSSRNRSRHRRKPGNTGGE